MKSLNILRPEKKVYVMRRGRYLSDREKSMEINGWKYDYESLYGWDARDKITNLNSLLHGSFWSRLMTTKK